MASHNIFIDIRPKIIPASTVFLIKEIFCSIFFISLDSFMKATVALLTNFIITVISDEANRDLTALLKDNH